jgi:hypothetical protein
MHARLPAGSASSRSTSTGSGFAPDVRHVRAATAARDKPVVAVRSEDHGVDLVSPEIGFATVRAAVLRFIQGITP